MRKGFSRDKGAKMVQKRGFSRDKGGAERVRQGCRTCCGRSSSSIGGERARLVPCVVRADHGAEPIVQQLGGGSRVDLCLSFPFTQSQVGYPTRTKRRVSRATTHHWSCVKMGAHRGLHMCNCI